MAWYDDPEEVRRATAEALGVSLMGVAEDEEPDTEPTLSLNRIPDESQTLDVKPKEWWEEEGAVEAAMEEAGVSYASPMRIERSLSEELGRGLARGTDQTQGLGYGFVGLLGQAVGLEGVEEYGVENYLRKMEEAALNEASVRDPFEEIDDLGDAGLYAAGIIGEQIPQLLASALGGGIGGLAAKTIGKRIVSNMIGKRVAAGMARDEAAKEVAKETAGTLLANAGRAGGVSGAYLANFGQISGGSFGQMAQELGRGDAGIAAGFAVPGAALDTLGEVFIASKFLKPFSKTQRAAVDGVDTSLSLGRVGGGAATGFAAGSVIEGGTEGVQTGLEQAALGAADPNRTIGDVVMTPEAGRERLIAAAAGATVGGPLGGVGGAFEVAFSPRTTQTLNDRARQTQTTQTTPETEQSPSRPLTGDWSQPVRVDDVMMQRNSSGVWAALNPAEDLLEGIPRVQAEDGTLLLVVSPETGDQASFLVARAEKALSDLNEGDLSPDFQSQDESQADLEDDLGEATELSEETEATRLRQSPLGAEALRQQLGETEAVAAALAEPPASTEQPGQPIKPASKSAEVIDAALSEEEQVRQGEVGAMGVRIQAGRQEKVASKIMAPDVDTGEALQRVRNAGVVGDQADILISNFYEKRKKELETAQEDRRKASEAALARPPVEAENFIKGLNTGDRVGLVGGQDSTSMVFVGRRKNGNAVFETFATSPVDGGQVGSRTRLELPSAQFARVTLAPPPQSNRTPLEQAFDDALGPNPTKQQSERVLGSPYTSKDAPQETTFSDGLGSEPIPLQVRWFNKKGEKGTVIPTFKGKFTNSPFTTVRQMNQGLEVTVPDEQLSGINKDIQVETVSDKKGGRRNIVTGVNLYGRTYRRSLRSPKDFSVDIPLTSKGANARKRGLLVFDNIYKNSPERIARSQAAVRGAQERQTPPEQMLREWELVQAGLNPVEYTFYEDALGRATDFINRSDLSENVKDEARFEAQNKIVKAFGNRKKRRGKQPAEGNAVLAKTYLEELEKLRGARLDDSRKRATRLIGNIERNPERMSDVEIARADDADPLRGPVEGSVAGQRAAAIEEKAIDEALKGNAVDLDRAVEATLKRLGKEQPKRTPKEVFNTRANLRSIATSYKNLGKFNPIYTAMNAVNTADRSIRRREMNEQTELITDREARELASRQRATQDPATTQEFAESEIELAQRADTMQTADRVVLPTDPEPEVNDTAAEINPDEPLLDQLSDARGRYYDLSEEDQILALRNRTLIKNERGKAVRGQKSSLTSAQKRRAKQIEQYLQNKQTYADLYPKSTAPSRRPNQPAAALPLGRFSTGEVLAGVAESPARGRARQDSQGRPESVGGPDRTGAGTVPGADNVRDGRSGVRASLAPQTVRGLSRAAKFRFVQSFGGLTDAEAAALTQAEIDLAYEAVTTRKRAGAVLGGRTVVGTTPKSLADLATMSGSELLAGATEARRAYEADREAVQVVRDNVGELLRTRAFADINTFLGAIGTSRLPRDLKLRAREFAKLTERGVDLNGVGVQIGRFGGDTSWAGIMTRETGDGYAIAINLDSLQDRDSAVNTILHELSHVVSAKKIAGEVRLNKVERDALNRLEALRREAVIAAARELGFDVPRSLTDADIQRLSQDLANRSNDPSGNNRVYSSLKDLTEFTTEISSNPELAGLMARLGFGQAKGKVTLLNAVRDAWNALVELIAGIKADPNSPLAKAFKDSWILNYSNAGGDMNLGDYTMPEIRRSTISRELQQRREVEETIDREIEARNLEGTTAQRKAIAKELAKPKSGRGRNNRAAAQQATGDTVQVAESPAVQRVSPAAAGRALLELARQSGDDIFSLPAQLSTSKNLQEVANSTGQSLKVFGNNDAMIVATAEIPEAGSRVTFLDNSGLVAEGTLVGTDGPVATVLHKRDGVNQRVALKNLVTELNIRAVGDAKSREFYVDSSAGLESSIPASIEIYQAIYQWAFNNGYTIVEDPRGTSWEGNFRRNAHQISSAIRTGSAEHFMPNGKGEDSQFEKMFPGATPDRRRALWEGLTFEEKIGTLARAEAAYVEQTLPEIVSMGYDAQPDTFTDESTGESLGRDEAGKRLDTILAGAKTQTTPYTERLGIRTVSRYGAAKSALEGSLGRVVEGSDNRRPNLEPALYSRARGRVWRERVRVTPTGGTISQGGMFAVDELLDKRAGDAYRTSRMAIKADISVIQELSRLLERQMKSLYKGQTTPLETINTALGNLENPLTAQQIDEIDRLFNARKTKQATDKRDQFIRENRKRFREETQPAALAQLPEELAATIREMSTHIESLSRRLVEKGGPVSGNLAVTVDEALGTYLNRSYAIFDDPKWADGVRKNAKVMDAARKFIRNSLTDSKAKNLIDDAATSGRVLSIADAKSMANDSVTDPDIEAMLEGYLAVGEEAPSVEVLSGRIPGQKNLSMLNPRGNIAPEIQALWGRYEDPTVNYAKTVMKLSSVIANNQFLTELRDLGVEEGWLWSSKNNPDDLRHPPGFIRISSESNPALTPIGGMYAHPMLAEGLFKMFPVGSTDQHYWWLQSAMKLTGISMAMKTVGSVASQIRNYLGNYLNLIATGNLGLGDIAPGSDFWERFKNSNDTVLANTFNKYRNATRAEWRAKIDDYIRRGIVGESVTTGLLEDLLTASRKAGSPDFGDVVWNKVSEPFKRVADFAVKTYSSGDDWFKVMIYEAEQDKYRKAYPEWDDNKVKEKAAEISRDIHWTYSLAPAIVQDLKKFPFVAPFVTFTTEVIRTTYNLQKLARQEIMEGRASGNKELEAMGWKRVRGMTTAAFLPAAAGATTMALAGISGDDEEDLRRFLPDWQKNSQLMLFRKENGEVSFVDVSFLDPYEYFKKPLTAFMRSLREAESADEILLGGTMAMVRQALDPFTSEQIFAGAIMDVMRNQDAAGRQVYNPQDTGANIGTAVASKIFIEPFTPGTFTSLERIGKAAFGVQSESGRAYSLFNELASVMAGQRVSQMDAQQALQFKGSRFMREMRDASALFNREFVSQGTRSAGDVVSGYDRSNGARRALVGSIRKDYLAAIRLGVPVARAKAILRDAGVGRETLRMATTGIYKPFEASEDSLSLVRARGKNDRITAYNQARRATPAKEVLP